MGTVQVANVRVKENMGTEHQFLMWTNYCFSSWLVVHPCCRVWWMEVVMAYLRYCPTICLLCQSQYLRQRKTTERSVSGHSTKHVQIWHALVCSFDPSDLELMPVNISQLGLHRWRKFDCKNFVTFKSWKKVTAKCVANFFTIASDLATWIHSTRLACFWGLAAGS